MNKKVFLATTSCLAFCYFSFFGVTDKKKPTSSLFDQNRPEEVQRIMDAAAKK
jgi:hypothetical protein